MTNYSRVAWQLNGKRLQNHKTEHVYVVIMQLANLIILQLQPEKGWSIGLNVKLLWNVTD